MAMNKRSPSQGEELLTEMAVNYFAAYIILPGHLWEVAFQLMLHRFAQPRRILQVLQLSIPREIAHLNRSN